MKLIYRGKAKELYETSNQNEIGIVYTDNATAGNGEKSAKFSNKGQLNLQISTIIYNYLHENNIRTHLLATDLTKNLQLCEKCQLIPLEVIVRNKVAGSMARKMGLEEGTLLEHPIFELSYKDDNLGDPFINDDYATALGICQRDELKVVKEMALTINKLLQQLFIKCNIELIDYKLEFGKNSNGEILLIDEISPDTMRLWDTQTKQPLDKDNFRKDIGDLVSNYQEVLNRLKELDV